MAWIPIYADEEDFKTIIEKLNADPEIAYILPDGNGRRVARAIARILPEGNERWIARAEVEDLPDGRYELWHTPGGKIPRFRKGKKDSITKSLGKLHKFKLGPMPIAAGWVEDPWKGWKGPSCSDSKTMPFLDSKPRFIELSVRRHGTDSTGSIGMSSFGWIGNRYRSIGMPAAKETENWWRRLNRWVSKEAVTKIPRSGDLAPEIWAFPSAYEKIRSGTPRDMNPLA